MSQQLSEFFSVHEALSVVQYSFHPTAVFSMPSPVFFDQDWGNVRKGR